MKNIFEHLANCCSLPPLDNLQNMISNAPEIQTAQNTRDAAEKLDKLQKTLDKHSQKLEQLENKNTNLQIYIAIWSVFGTLLGGFILLLIEKLLFN